MSQYSRVRCNASISSTGKIVIGTALTGFKAPPFMWFDGTNTTVEELGRHQYVLEDAAGAWEIGYVEVLTSGDNTRVIVESSGGGFANNTSALIFSMSPGISNSFCGPTSTIPPKASLTSMAVGQNAKVKLNVGQSMAMGPGSHVDDAYAVAIGFGAVAYQKTESVIGRIRQFQAEWTGDVGTTGTPMTISGDAWDMAEWDAIWTSRSDGMMRIKGTLTVTDDADSTNTAKMKVINVDYVLWVVPGSSSATLLGTATLASLFTGGSAPNSSFSIQSGTGAILIGTTYSADTITIRGILEVHDFQTQLGSINGVE